MLHFYTFWFVSLLACVNYFCVITLIQLNAHMIYIFTFTKKKKPLTTLHSSKGTQEIECDIRYWSSTFPYARYVMYKKMLVTYMELHRCICIYICIVRCAKKLLHISICIFNNAIEARLILRKWPRAEY